MSEVGPFKYWAFISYSHHDRRWGAWLMRRLEAYRLPRALVGRASRDGPLPQRLFPVFRDRDELASSSELGAEIQRALRASRYLVVICSPHSAASRWVNEEIQYFKALGREDRVLCFIVDGEPGSGDARECFAPALRFRLGTDGKLSDRPIEPVAADARVQGDGRDRARIKLMAGLLGIGYDELRRRDLVTRNRRLGFITGVSIVITAVTVLLALTAYVARQNAERSRQQAEDLIGFMLGDLRARLEPVGRLDVLDVVGTRAMQYFADAERSGQTDTTLAARAKTLRQLGEIRTQQGRLAEAEQSFGAALALDRDLAQRQPLQTQAIFNLGQSEYWTGYAAWLAGDFTAAQAHFLAYRETGRRLLQLEPGKAEWLQELEYGESNLGTLAEAQGQLESALSHFEATRGITQGLMQAHADNAGYQLDHAESLSWVAAVLQKLNRNDEARTLLEQQAQLLRQLIAHSPQDIRLQYRYALSQLNLLELQAITGQLTGYAQRSAEVLRMTEDLVRRDPANLDWVDALERSHELNAIGHEFRRQLDSAAREVHAAIEFAEKCHRADPGQSRWRRIYVRVGNALADLQMSRGLDRQAEATLTTTATAAAEMTVDTEESLQVAVDRVLLQLELARREARAPSDSLQVTFNRLLPRLDKLAPESAAAARLRRAVINNPAAPLDARQAVPTHCGITQVRLQRFLERNGVATRLAACTALNLSQQKQEKN